MDCYAQNSKILANQILDRTQTGEMLSTSERYQPMMIKGINIQADDPFQMDFIIDPGETVLSQDQIKAQSSKLIQYFLTALTIPEDELWVNLSPYEKNRIIPDSFSKTHMGHDLLALDYLLKQLTSTLMYPEKELGRDFWKQIHEKAHKEYGTMDIPIDTYNKVWIVPEEAFVYEHAQGAYVVKSHLKVMLEEDYLAIEERSSAETKQKDSSLSSKKRKMAMQVVRDIIIPEIEKEINQGKTFANLRQIYHSMILAVWYKQTLKDSIITHLYADQNKLNGIKSDKEDIPQRLYKQYIESFKKGVFDFIKEDYDSVNQRTIPRRYFSGGVILSGKRKDADYSMFSDDFNSDKDWLSVKTRLKMSSVDLSKDEAVLNRQSVEFVLRHELSKYKDENLAYRPEELLGEGHILPGISEEVLTSIIQILERHHKGQVRADGFTKYITHPLGVAGIYVNELGLTDSEAFIAALMHDALENSITYYTDRNIDNLSHDEAYAIRKNAKKLKRTKRLLSHKAKQIKNEMIRAGVTDESIDLDKVLRIVLSLSKYDKQKLVDQYLSGIVKEGPHAIAIKMSDQIHNIRSNVFAANPKFVQRYIFGDGKTKSGSIYIYLEAPLGEERKPFIDYLPDHLSYIKNYYQIYLLQTLLDNLNRIDEVTNIAKAVQIVNRIAPEVNTDRGFSSRRKVLLFGIDALIQMLPDQSMFATNQVESKNKGGIDLNPELLNLKIQKDNQGLIFSLPAHMEHVNSIDGLEPVILQITPIPTVPILYNLTHQKSSEKSDI